MLLVPARILPAFTTVDTLFHREQERWLTAREKLMAMGFPVSAEIAATYGVAPCLEVDCSIEQSVLYCSCPQWPCC